MNEQEWKEWEAEAREYKSDYTLTVKEDVFALLQERNKYQEALESIYNCQNHKCATCTAILYKELNKEAELFPSPSTSEE